MNLENLANLVIRVHLVSLANLVNLVNLVLGGFGGSGRMMCEWLVGQWIGGLTSSQKIFGFVLSKRSYDGEKVGC